MARPKPWVVDDELWAVIEPLLPKVKRRTRHPGRKRHPDRLVFQDILFVLLSRNQKPARTRQEASAGIRPVQELH